VISVAHVQIAFREIHSLHARQFSEITITHFLPAGGEEMIE
jgi:hypothetical protein